MRAADALRFSHRRPHRYRRAFITALALAGLVIGLPPAGAETPMRDSATRDPWPDLVRDAFDSRPIADGSGILALEMPYRAEDAAIVPVTMRIALPPGDERRVKTLTLVIDENPSPVAATFTLGETAGVTAISTRVRVNSYSNVHAVAEMSDGKLYAVVTYVKASGGCSAPAAKSAGEATAHLGELRFRRLPPPEAPTSSTPREAQFMIRHPNNSGLQMDQVTRLYVPAMFVQALKIWQGDDLVLAMDGGISISEDPNIRFTYRPNGAKTFRAEVRDTDNRVFTSEWPADGTTM